MSREEITQLSPRGLGILHRAHFPPEFPPVLHRVLHQKTYYTEDKLPSVEHHFGILPNFSPETGNSHKNGRKISRYLSEGGTAGLAFLLQKRRPIRAPVQRSLRSGLGGVFEVEGAAGGVQPQPGDRWVDSVGAGRSIEGHRHRLLNEELLRLAQRADGRTAAALGGGGQQAVVLLAGPAGAVAVAVRGEGPEQL